MSSDLPAITLLQQMNATPKTGQDLEVLGKEAANKYLSGKSNLTDAVVGVVKEAGLSPEQVRRVIEFANTHAFLEEFKKEGAHHVVEFAEGPADPSAILKDLNDGGGGTVFDSGLDDYKSPPPDVKKTAAANMSKVGIVERELAEAFACEDPELPYANPYTEILDLREKLAGAYEEITSQLSSLESEYIDIEADLFKTVKQAALEGTSLGRMLQAWQEVTENPEVVKVAFEVLSPALVENGVFPSQTAVAESCLDLEKTASLVNTEHPLVHTFSRFSHAIEKAAQLRGAREELAVNIDHINSFMKLAAGEAALGAKALDLGKKIGKGAWNHKGKILTALALEEGYQRSKYDPRFQPIGRAVHSAENALLSRIPVIPTQAKAERFMSMARGGM